MHTLREGKAYDKSFWWAFPAQQSDVGSHRCASLS